MGESCSGLTVCWRPEPVLGALSWRVGAYRMALVDQVVALPGVQLVMGMWVIAIAREPSVGMSAECDLH